MRLEHAADHLSLEFEEAPDYPSGVQDVCVTEKTLFAASNGSVVAYRLPNDLLWEVRGKLRGLQEEIVACSVAADRKGRFVAVADSANKKVLLFSSDGTFQRFLVEGGLEGIQLIRWLEQSSQLVILHQYNANAIHFLVVKLDLNTLPWYEGDADDAQATRA